MFNPAPKPEKTPKKKRKGIKKISEKRMTQIAAYSLIRRKFLMEHENCEVCSKPAHEVHHKWSRIDKMLNNTDYFMSVCRSCHVKIHDNPTWAYQRSYLISDVK